MVIVRVVMRNALAGDIRVGMKVFVELFENFLRFVLRCKRSHGNADLVCILRIDERRMDLYERAERCALATCHNGTLGAPAQAVESQGGHAALLQSIGHCEKRVPALDRTALVGDKLVHSRLLLWRVPRHHLLGQGIASKKVRENHARVGHRGKDVCTLLGAGPVPKYVKDTHNSFFAVVMANRIALDTADVLHLDLGHIVSRYRRNSAAGG